MELIDTHTHIYLPEFDSDRDQVVERAVQNGVIKLLMPNIDVESVNSMFSSEARYPGICYPMIGLHPTSVKDDYQEQLDRLTELTASHKFYGIGEIGIDLYWDRTHINEQIKAFRLQVAFGIETGLPVVIHCRNSFREVFEALEEFRGSGIKGVFHAFTGSVSDAEKAVTFGFKLGIGGIVTFKNSGLDKTVKEVGCTNIVLETDSPYLAPVPNRGKRNESSYLCIILDKLAEICGIDKEEVASVTFANSVELFKL
ncbi:MAG: TatD family hydrolase [Bacteroidales bacterium]